MTDTDPSADERMKRVLGAYAKRELRTRMQSLRNVLPNSARDERSTRACDFVMRLPEFAAARSVAGYVAIKNELDVSAVLRAAAAAGKRVLLPRIGEDGLTFHVHVLGEALEENGWGVREPFESAERVEIEDIDLVLVPALAIDLRGQRIGYGKSFYDRVLRRARGTSVGVIYDFQLLAEVPSEEHDVPVKVVVTDRKSLVAETEK